MSSATVTVESVQRVEGVSKKTGKPYTRFVVHAGGQEYKTFDAALCISAEGLVKRQAVVEFEDGPYGKDLKSITAAPNGTAAEDHRAVTPDGAVDWDTKDLRINRCAFWKELLGPAMHTALMTLPKDASASDVVTFVARVGPMLRQVAEADVYSSKAPAQDGDWVPF